MARVIRRHDSSSRTACRRPAPPRPPVVATIDVPDEIQAAVAAKDRTPADRALDAGRHPAETLAFFGIAPGMKVAELGAGGGYTTELLARGHTPVVYTTKPGRPAQELRAATVPVTED